MKLGAQIGIVSHVSARSETDFSLLQQARLRLFNVYRECPEHEISSLYALGREGLRECWTIRDL